MRPPSRCPIFASCSREIKDSCAQSGAIPRRCAVELRFATSRPFTVIVPQPYLTHAGHILLEVLTSAVVNVCLDVAQAPRDFQVLLSDTFQVDYRNNGQCGDQPTFLSLNTSSMSLHSVLNKPICKLTTSLSTHRAFNL